MKVTAGRDHLGDFAPFFAELNDDVLYGKVWERKDLLSERDRCIVTVSTLIATGILNETLNTYILKAKENGVSKSEMVEIITQIGFYGAWPKAWAALNVAKEVYSEEE